MSDKGEIVLSGQGHSEKPSWLTQQFNRFASALIEKKEAERVLSENEKALERMSDIALDVRKLLDDPEFIKNEKIYSQSIGNQNIESGNTYIKDSNGCSFSINTRRDASGKAFMIEVYESPSDTSDYMSGKDDGYFRYFFSEDTIKKTRKGKETSFSWSNTSIHGDKYLGIETSSIIDDISIDHISTRVNLRGVDFGGDPSVHVTLLSTAKDDNGNFIGPIGKINELWIHGLARAIHPVKEHIMDSDFGSIPIEDNFDHIEKPFTFDGGNIKFEATKKIDEKSGKEMLVFEFSGTRERFSGDRDKPDVFGPEKQTLAVPTDITNGNRVIDLFEKATKEIIEACGRKPQLEATNS